MILPATVIEFIEVLEFGFIFDLTVLYILDGSVDFESVDSLKNVCFVDLKELLYRLR